eukprot:175017-Amphidinium_carterae.1
MSSSGIEGNSWCLGADQRFEGQASSATTCSPPGLHSTCDFKRNMSASGFLSVNDFQEPRESAVDEQCTIQLSRGHPDPRVLAIFTGPHQDCIINVGK